MAFCGGRLGAETAELWCGGRNPLRRELASTLTSRSHGILQLFKEQRHVSGDAPLWAHFPFMYCSGLLQGFVGVQKRGNCALFFMHRIFRRRDMSANRKASDSRIKTTEEGESRKRAEGTLRFGDGNLVPLFCRHDCRSSLISRAPPRSRISAI